MITNELKKIVAETMVHRELAFLPRDRAALIGLGTGTTAIWGIRYLAQIVTTANEEKKGPWVDAGLTYSPLCVATSSQSHDIARALGLNVGELNDAVFAQGIDLAFDGADEVSPQGFLIKGGGAAHAREKLIEHRAKRFVVVVDETKLVDLLGSTFAVPIEIMPMARESVRRVVESLGAVATLREGSGKIGPLLTDNGLHILDARFPKGLPLGTELNPTSTERFLKSLPGVLEVGIFTCPVAQVYIGYQDGRVESRLK